MGGPSLGYAGSWYFRAHTGVPPFMETAGNEDLCRVQGLGLVNLHPKP